MNSRLIRSSAVVAALVTAIAGGVDLDVDKAFVHTGPDVNPWNTAHGVGTAQADGAAPEVTEFHITRVVDKGSSGLFVS